MGVVDYFEYRDITDKIYLNTPEGYNFYLFQIVGMGELRIKNPSLCEKGDDYVTIELEQITFQDTK
jgi:hypothetical protein